MSDGCKWASARNGRRRWDAASPARLTSEARRRLQSLGAGEGRRDLAEDRRHDAAQASGQRGDQDDGDEGQDEAVLDGRLPLLAPDELSHEALEVGHKHVVTHPLLYADRFCDPWLALSSLGDRGAWCELLANRRCRWCAVSGRSATDQGSGRPIPRGKP